MKKKVRIILLSNHANALFFASSIQKHKDGFETIIIYSPPKNAFSHLNFDHKFHKKLCLLPFSKDIKVLNYKFNFFLADDIINIFNSRKFDPFYKIQCRKLKNFLKEKKINIHEINELWFGWSQLKYVFFYMLEEFDCKYYKFDHGFGDIRATIYDLKDNLRTQIRFLKNKFFRHYVNVPKYNYVTLFYDEINRINNSKNNRLIKIMPNSCKINIRICEKKIRKNYLKISIKENSAVLMVDYICLTQNKNKDKDIKKFFNELTNFIDLKISQDLKRNDIKNIIIKTKIHNNLNSRIFIKYLKDKYKQKYDVYLFNEIIKGNYNIEYCINLLKCKIILSTFSSGQLTLMKINNKIPKNYIFTEWYLNFWRKKGKSHLIHHDFTWIIKFFYKFYYKYFKYILPKFL